MPKSLHVEPKIPRLELPSRGTSSPLRAAIFDFDLTLTTHHCFRYLAHQSDPKAMSELGQIARIAQLDDMYDEGKSAFATWIMGGADRVAALHDMFIALSSSGVECLVCTKGYVGPSKMILAHVELLKFFSEVYGRTGDHYGNYEFDVSADPGDHICYAGTLENQAAETKLGQVQSYMQRRGFHFDDVVFIDDTSEEVRSMHQTCKAIHVTSDGMSSEDMKRISQLAVPPEPLTQVRKCLSMVEFGRLRKGTGHRTPVQQECVVLEELCRPLREQFSRYGLDSKFDTPRGTRKHDRTAIAGRFLVQQFLNSMVH
jgi:phosphoglycolate phosphatase-like HAD superfamily hydrolase